MKVFNPQDLKHCHSDLKIIEIRLIFNQTTNLTNHLKTKRCRGWGVKSDTGGLIRRGK